MPAWPSRAKRYRSLVLAALLLASAVVIPFDSGPLSPPLTHASAANHVTVTTTADTVDGNTASMADLNGARGPDQKISLREAITAANNTPSGESLTIDFAIPTNDPGYDAVRQIWLIRPTGALPPLVRGDVTIDGTQLSSPQQARIVLDGIETADPVGFGNGIAIRSSGNTIRRLGIVNFPDSGVLISGDQAPAANNRVVGCVIGMSTVDDEAEPNYVGVEISGGAYQNQIGGADSTARNLISGNDYGVVIAGTGTRLNLVIGNWIGTGHSGRAPLGNTVRGVVLRDGARENSVGSATPGEGNVIADSEIGVEISGAAAYNVVAGNIIGLGADGTTAREDPSDESTSLANFDGGIFIIGGAHDNLIGGVTPTARNIIANNGQLPTIYGHGVYLNDTGTHRNSIQGNYIGVDRTGILGRGNLSYGVNIVEGANGTVVGGAEEGAGNVIAYNGAGGLRLSSTANQVAGNIIGLGADGATPLGNQFSGVLATGAGNVIGPGNHIAYNQWSGIIITATGENTTVEGNTIHDNDISGVCVQGSDTTVISNTIERNGRFRAAVEECRILGGVVVDQASHTKISGNSIRNNLDVGIRISGGKGNRILTNSISGNMLAGIQLEAGGNDGIAPPRLEAVGPRSVAGRGCARCKIELFADRVDEGRYFVNTTTAADDGTFALTFDPAQLPERYLTATNTDSLGNTSGFATPKAVPDTLKPSLGYDRYLPLVGR
ncbi:MAG TPA: right-handed parallel beta-helix repeat-containing protein [Roseiflexaceae bacterium]|nr:right-handed parallel beta-helix repeat-containing protein [Roseiflexaceae bacterium]